MKIPHLLRKIRLRLRHACRKILVEVFGLCPDCYHPVSRTRTGAALCLICGKRKP
jgi:hypothetical protein